jgi:tRNA (cmo5U34)-methyltransferase
MKRDTLFNTDSPSQDFSFNEQVAEVFDDMLERSIPCYHQVMKMTAQLIAPFVTSHDRIYDLGCSTGKPLLTLASHFGNETLEYVGIDNSQAMINKAKRKAELFTNTSQIDFLLGDITRIELAPCKVILLNYTLQFLRPLERADFLRKIHGALLPGGIIIMGEKIISHHSKINRVFIDLYFDFKREQGYSEIEIAKKRETLENILIPFSIAENKNMLKNAGFSQCETFFQWFNFISFIGLKEERTEQSS